MTAKKTSSHSARPSFVLPVRNFAIPLGVTTKIMGVINMTPDSFSGDGVLRVDRAFRQALRQIREGADILDVGGESSRPGAEPISEKEEASRILPLIKKLTALNQVPISVDTYKANVAKAALDTGANIINLIQGTPPDKRLLKMIKQYDAVIVLMHMRGTPKTMQEKTQYKNLLGEISSALQNAVENCLEIGIKSDKIIVDPGLGFAKTAEQNLQILNRLSEFHRLKKPVLVGPSRKSFIGKVLNTGANKRLPGTIASAVAAAVQGAHIIRVHDIKPVKEALMVADAIINS